MVNVDVIVTISLFQKENYVKIVAFQEQIADSDYGHSTYNMSCTIGWSYFFMNLRSIFESGNDLREVNLIIAQQNGAYTLNT